MFKWIKGFSLLILVVVFSLFLMFSFQNQQDIDKKVSIFGNKPMVVLSDSMNPVFKTGDLIFVKQVDEVKKNNVITYKFEDKLITHRVVEVSNQNGMPVYYTKGDNNGAADKEVVLLNQIVGVQSIVIPSVGNIILFMSSAKGILLLIILPLVFVALIEIYNRLIKNKDNKKLRSLG